jgi:hypothetical protein
MMNCERGQSISPMLRNEWGAESLTYLPKVVEAMQSVAGRLAQRHVIDTLEEHGANDFLQRERQWFLGAFVPAGRLRLTRQCSWW